MSAPLTDSPTKLERVLSEIAPAKHAEALGALVLGALSRQAEGQTLFVAPDLAETMASQHGIDAEKAQLESANVLSVLKRGPSTESEHLLLSGLAVKGLGALPEPEREAQLQRFARHAVWLETSTPYEVFAFVDLALTVDDAATVWRAVGDSVLAEDMPSVAARARNAARISALCRSTSPEAERQVERLAGAALDPGVRALLTGLAGGAAFEARLVSGRMGRLPPRSGVVGALRVLSGFAFLEWLARLFAAVVGLRSEGQVALTSAGDVRVRSTTRLLGRVIRNREETLPRAGLSRVGRYARFPALLLLVGAVGLALGVVLGGLAFVEGVRGGDAILLLTGASVLLAGALCDLVATILAGARRGEVSVFVEGPGHRVCVSGVPAEEAEGFLAAFSDPA